MSGSASQTELGRWRLLVIEDHAIVREGLKMLLSAAPYLEVVGSAADADQAYALTVQQRPDLIVLDLDLGADDGLLLLPRLTAAVPLARVVVLTGVASRERHAEALIKGARGLVLKTHAPEVLLKAIRRVQRGELWFDRALLDSVLQRTLRPDAADPVQVRIASLTAREREVIAMVGEGLKNQDIGRRLRISEKTVRNHLSAVFCKLEIEDRLRLLMFAYQHGLAKPPI